MTTEFDLEASNSSIDSTDFEGIQQYLIQNFSVGTDDEQGGNRESIKVSKNQNSLSRTGSGRSLDKSSHGDGAERRRSTHTPAQRSDTSGSLDARSLHSTRRISSRTIINRNNSRRSLIRTNSSDTIKNETETQNDSDSERVLTRTNSNYSIIQHPVSPLDDEQQGDSKRNTLTRTESKRGVGRSKSNNQIQREMLIPADSGGLSATTPGRRMVSRSKSSDQIRSGIVVRSHGESEGNSNTSWDGEGEGEMNKNESTRRLNTRRENVPRLNLRRAGSKANLDSSTHSVLRDKTNIQCTETSSQLDNSMHLEIGDHEPCSGSRCRERMVTVDNVLQWKQDRDGQLPIDKQMSKQESVRRLNETAKYLTQLNQKILSDDDDDDDNVVDTYDWVAIKAHQGQLQKVSRASRAG